LNKYLFFFYINFKYLLIYLAILIAQQTIEIELKFTTRTIFSPLVVNNSTDMTCYSNAF